MNIKLCTYSKKGISNKFLFFMKLKKHLFKW